MLDYTVAPLTDRTWFTTDHARSQFTATWADTLDRLERELGHLEASDLVFEVDVRRDQVRNDGQIKANAAAASPAVVIRFDSAIHGPLVYRCDRFDLRPWSGKGMTALWHHNVRAIALTLERLRQAEMYGAIDAGQQYAGFKALPAGRAMPASHMTRDDAFDVLERVAIGDEGPLRDRTLRDMADDPAVLIEVYRQARITSHPDRNGGRHETWHKVEEAGRVLGIQR